MRLGLLLVLSFPALAVWGLHDNSNLFQSLTTKEINFVEPVCNSTITFNDVSWANGSSPITAGKLRFGCQGSVRQLHWHPYADEWAYVSKGSFLVTVTGPGNDPWPVSYNHANAGSTWFFPKGWWHIILCETEECELVLFFNNQAFIGKDDLDVVQAMLALPPQVAAATLNMPLKQYESDVIPRLTAGGFNLSNAISNSPAGSCIGSKIKCPLPSGAVITTFQPSVVSFHSSVATPRHLNAIPNTCKNGMLGADVWDIKASTFPFLRGIIADREARRAPGIGMSGQFMTVHPGGSRPPVWVTNANAVLYQLSGELDIIIYGGPTPELKKTIHRKRLVPGDIAFIPTSSMYYMHNPSCTTAANATLSFDHPQWEEQDMGLGLQQFPKYAVAASLNLLTIPTEL